MPRRRVKTASSSKRRTVIGCFGVVLLAYIALVSRFLSSQPSSIPFKIDHLPAAASSHDEKPPLDTLVQGWNITGNVSWLMDFSIVGFPKTGTSTLMFYLEQYTDAIFTFPDERCELGWNQHVKLIRALYRQYQPNRIMGIKCPRDLEIDLALSNYNKYFPTTKFIVGLRHPILWFQSFYNFRVANEFPMPPAETLIGSCKRANQGVCTYRANFSKHLQQIEPWRRVFLYHVDQLKEKSAADESNNNFDQSKHLSILHQNLMKFTQRGVLERMAISEEENWDDAVHMNLQFALLSHGSVNGLDGPIHNYANFAACSAFELSRAALLQIPACRVAAPGMDQETWSMILQRLQQDHGNVLEDYQGYRASLKNGRRFYIRDAVVWNCYTDDGEYYGQAILFDRQKVSFVDQESRMEE